MAKSRRSRKEVAAKRGDIRRDGMCNVKRCLKKMGGLTGKRMEPKSKSIKKKKKSIFTMDNHTLLSELAS